MNNNSNNASDDFLVCYEQISLQNKMPEITACIVFEFKIVSYCFYNNKTCNTFESCILIDVSDEKPSSSSTTARTLATYKIDEELKWGKFI